MKSRWQWVSVKEPPSWSLLIMASMRSSVGRRFEDETVIDSSVEQQNPPRPKNSER